MDAAWGSWRFGSCLEANKGKLQRQLRRLGNVLAAKSGCGLVCSLLLVGTQDVRSCLPKYGSIGGVVVVPFAELRDLVVEFF